MPEGVDRLDGGGQHVFDELSRLAANMSFRHDLIVSIYGSHNGPGLCERLNLLPPRYDCTIKGTNGEICRGTDGPVVASKVSGSGWGNPLKEAINWKNVSRA